jgi:uncharacterized RDD family membrane protein YckC
MVGVENRSTPPWHLHRIWLITMTSPPLNAQSPPVVEPAPIAAFWRRLAALLIDLVILGVPALLFGFAVFRWAVTWGYAGRLVGFVATLLYFGLLNSRFGGGRTIGKWLLGIRVADRGGNPLSPTRSVLRFVVIALPWFLNGLIFDTNPASAGLREYLLAVFLVFAVFGVSGAIVYLFIFNRRTRQSLHDLAVGSFVIRRATTAIPARLATARLHLIVVGCWLALIGLGPVAILPFVIGSSHHILESLDPLYQLQVAIKTQLSLRRVSVMTGQTVNPNTGASPTSFLEIDAQSQANQNDLLSLAPLIADIVLDRHPDLLGNQFLIVQVWRGFDFGIASWSASYREALDVAGWREKLGKLHPESRKI